MIKYIFISISFSILLLGIVFNVYGNSSDIAEEAGLFEYNAGSRRDPFLSLVTEGGRIVSGYVTGPIGSIKDVKLEGIVYDPDGESIAIINGLILKKNDIIGNVKLIGIESDKVTIIFDKTEYVFSLEEE